MTRPPLRRRFGVGAVVACLIVSAGCGSAAPVDQLSSPVSVEAPTDTLSIDAGSAPSTGAVHVNGPATATTPAVRVDPPPRTSCEAIALRVSKQHSAAGQLVIVTTEAWGDSVAVLRVATRSGSVWSCGTEIAARIGRAGFRPLVERRSGDDTTPAGIFPLATMTAWDGTQFSFFGNAADPGVTAGRYRRVRTGDCFGAAPNTPGYGHLRYDTACPGPDDEYLPRFIQAYTSAALIGANMEPDVSGDAAGEVPYAAAIFLHHNVYDGSGVAKPTSGCVSIAQPDLDIVLRGIRSDTLFVMGPAAWLLDS